MAGYKTTSVLFAAIVASLLGHVLSMAVTAERGVSLGIEGEFDALENSADFSQPYKRSTETHHVTKREASLRTLSKRQTAEPSELERLLFRSSSMFLEAYQAFDTVVMDALIEVSDQINATIQALGRGGAGATPSLISKLSAEVDGIAANVSRNSVLPTDCGRDPQISRALLQGNLPWVVQIGYRVGDRQIIGCVGVIISPYHVLADAACSAVSKWNTVITNDGDYQVAERWIHTRIRSDDDLKNGHNIGILMMTNPFSFNEKVQPSCLPALSDAIGLFSQQNSTLIGIEEFGEGLRVYNWQRSRTSGPLLCYEILEELNRKNPSRRNLFTENLKVSHLCVWRPFGEADLSMVMRPNPVTGRIEVIGVGPLSDPNVDIPIFYTQTHSHLFWIELMAKNSIKLLA